MLNKIKFFVFFFFVLLQYSCNKSDSQSLIEGNIEGKQNISTVFLEKLDEKDLKYKVLSLSRVVDGKFQFKFEFTEPELMYLRFEGKDERLAILIESHLLLRINPNSILKSKVILGIENKYLFEYNNKSLIIKKKSDSFRKANLILMRDARLKNNKRVVDSLLKINYKINYGYIQNMEYHLKKHPNTFVSVMLIDGLFKYPYVKKNTIQGHYNSLNERYKSLSLAKKIKVRLDNMK